MKIKVLEIIGDSTLAGAPRHLLSIVENIDTEKFGISCITPPGPLAGEIRKIRHHVPLDVIRMDSRLSLKSIKKIRKSIKSMKPDVIHVHGTRAGSVARLAAVGLNLPVLYTEHLWTRQFRLSALMTFLHYNANWFLDLFTSFNIAVSRAVEDFLIYSKITRPEKVKVIYNGIEPSKLMAKTFQSNQEFLLATVATLNPNKGIQYLIESLPRVIKEFPGIRLEIVGDGVYRRKLVNLVKKRKLQNYIKFTGFVPDVEKYLVKFDLYVQPSLSESFGLAILQAMNVGLPVVATNTGGIPEVVTEGKSGVLVKPEDKDELAEGILFMIRHPEKARKMGELGKREVKVRFNIKDMIGELEALYESFAKNPAFPK